jgi:hypothetical protein
MEVVIIEKKTYEQMMQRFEEFVRQVEKLCGDSREKENWLTGDDVHSLLQISMRTLQTYRDNGTLPYSQIGHKCYYKVADVEKFISKSQIKK